MPYGVYYRRKRYHAKISVNRVPYHLGHYATAEEAAEVAASFKAQKRGI